ncbi:TlpA family protein disulfide reductase [Pedobacter frigoris]|uniref:TlpA family protein disulfide reductase n=1 Tax=Pedobacter frigoris TaxID=2571272 RepID=A0A4U1CNW2_9SPHI|nr:TlpA disulfide reductase family protein [Pedobacter frigoris]TKC09641.1 TlpA family protein disulfide reductase [Pedobacter frigoris]
MNLIKRLTLLCLCFFAFTQVYAQKGTGFITLKGQLKGFSNQVEVEDMSEFQYLLPPSAERVFVPDANGNFTMKFKAGGPNYYRLGRNALYLTPGDNLEVFIDKGNPKVATFKGVGAEANVYMKDTPFPKGGSFIEAGKQIKETPEETLNAVEAMAAARSKELALVTGVSPEFKRLEAGRIKADLINSMYSSESYGRMKKQLKADGTPLSSEDYKKVILPKVKALNKNFTDPSLMKLVVYRDVAEQVIEEGGKPADIQAIKDWYTSSTLVREMQKISNKQQLNLFNPKIATISTPAYKTAVSKMLKQLMAFGEGDQAVDFTALDMDGKKVNLSSLKGKVLYVDLWATWCGPCMQEMPHYEKLKEKYKDNPNVAFVSLSIDDGEELWKKSVSARSADGYQWLINRSKLDAYNIVGIPRTLLIDKDFKIVDMNAPMPSESAAVKAIDELLK